MAAEQLDRVAEVPMALGKGLCACFGCKLVKTQQQVNLQAIACCMSSAFLRASQKTLSPSAICIRACPLLPVPCCLCILMQFLDNGCENCPDLNMEEDSDRVHDATSVNFSG